MQNLVSQVLEPTIGTYFRNSAQDSDVISFLKSRKERQSSAKEHIKAVLDEYNVHAVDTLIGDINPPESLMKTLTDRKIAEEEKVTFETQKQAQDQRKDYEASKALSDIQSRMVGAQQGVEISQREAEAKVKTSEGEANAMKVMAIATAESIKIKAEAEAEQIQKIGSANANIILETGKATAESYKLQVGAMGADNFSRFKITEEISKGHVKIIPDILIGSSNGTDGGVNGLLGMKLMEMMDMKKIEDKPQSNQLND